MPWADGDSSSRIPSVLESTLIIEHGIDRCFQDGSVILPYPAEDAATALALTSQAVFGTVFRAYKSVTVSNFYALAGGAMTSAVGNRLGLYTVAGDQSMTLVARNASLDAAWVAGWFSSAFNATGGYVTSYALVAGSVYCVAAVQNGSSGSPTLRGFAYGSAPSQSAPALHLFKPTVTVTGQTDLPTTIAAGAATSVNALCIGVY